MRICFRCKQPKDSKPSVRYCLSCERKRHRQWKLTNPNKEKTYKQSSRMKLKDLGVDYNQQYYQRPQVKLRRLISLRILSVLKKNKITKSAKTLDLLGCTIPEARRHIESQFKDGMTWENHGAWHIDHIKPCASFDLTQPDQQRLCFHYSNLQPLWAQENLSKGSKII